ncbi:hypothetical protein GCM10018965_082190 [Nonomuraea roseola]
MSMWRCFELSRRSAPETFHTFGSKAPGANAGTRSAFTPETQAYEVKSALLVA